MFSQNLIELPKLKRIESPCGRRYEAPNGILYPSVTTVIGHYSDKSGLDRDWETLSGFD